MPVAPTVELVIVIGVAVEAVESEKKADPCATAVNAVVLMAKGDVHDVPIVPPVALSATLPAVTVSPVPVKTDVALLALRLYTLAAPLAKPPAVSLTAVTTPLAMSVT